MSQIIQLPAPQTPPLPFFDVSPILDAVTYTLRFQWNEQDGNWWLSILDEPGQVTLAGSVRLVADWPLYKTQLPRVPPGYLIASDTSGNGANPNLGDLGQGARVQIHYVTAAEVAAIRGA